MAVRAEDPDEFLFREYTRRLSIDPVAFFRAREDLDGMRDVIGRRLARQVFSHARSKGIPFDDLEDTAGYILDKLAQDSKVSALISTAEETAIGYAYKALRQWINSDTDRTFTESYTDAAGKNRTRTSWIDHVGIDTPEAESYSPAPAFEVEMSLTEAIDHTATLLEQFSSTRLVDQVFPAVEWLTLNWPARRSYEHETLTAAVQAFPHLHTLQVHAVATATWGARNQTEETSLISGYLRIPNFNPIRSRTHRRVLNQYRCKVQPALVAA